MGRIFVVAILREVGFLCGSRFDLAMSTLVPAAALMLMAALYAAATPRDMPLVAVDHDASAFSRDALMKIDATAAIRIAYARSDLAAALPLIRSNRAFGVLYIPKHAGREAQAGRQARLTLFVNASYYTASIMLARDGARAIAGLNAELLRVDTARIKPKSVRPPPFDVQATTLFNPSASYELMIVSLLHPALIVIFLSCAVITTVGRTLEARQSRRWIVKPGWLPAAFAGRMLPYFLIYLGFGAVCIVWLSLRGYPIAGSLALLLIGYGLMLAAYIGLGALMVAVTRDAAMALGAAAVYASSAMAFSGAFFPIDGAGMFARSWNAIQPYTWYAKLSAQQWQMGVPPADSLHVLAILAAMAAVALTGALAALSFARRAERGGA